MKIDDLRREIDKTDEIIVSAFRHRLRLSEKIGLLKKEMCMPVKDIKREEEILEKLCRTSENDAEAIRELYETVFAISRKSQK